MAKNNNLTDFLTDVADAIRQKKGTSASINPQDFSKEIKGIYDIVTQGIQEKAVTFYDYDGTILYSFTKEEFLRLGSMPPLPTRKGMTYQQWNWYYEDAVQHLAKYDIIEIAATCITADGKTRLYISVDTYNDGLLKLRIGFSEILVQWGDGTEDMYSSGSDYTTITHEYREIGDYCISITVISGALLLGDDINLAGTIRSNHIAFLYKVEIGENCFFRDGLFNSAYRLTSINVPQGITYIPQVGFSECYSLPFIGIPYGCETIARLAFAECSTLKVVSLPNTIKKVGEPGYSGNTGAVFQFSGIRRIYISGSIKSDYLFQSCFSLKEAYLPEYFDIGQYMFESCALRRIDIPEGVSIIRRFAFQYCRASYIKFPSTLTKVEGSLSYLLELTVADFTSCATVIDFSGFYPASRMHSKFKAVVADAMFEDWLEKLITVSDKVGDYVSWPFVSTDVIPSECISLEISPLKAEVDASTTRVGLKISGLVNGRKITTGEVVENAIYKATVYSEEFEQNTSSEAITRELSYTLLGVTATTTITQAGVATTTES